MSEGMQHIEYAYPTMDQGAHSLQHMVQQGLGNEPFDLNTFVAHAYCVEGAGLREVFPLDGKMRSSEGMTAAQQKKLKAGLQEIKSMQDSGAIDWKQAIKLILTLLLQIFGCLLLLVGFCGVSQAAGGPPQNMLAVTLPQNTLSVVRTKPACSCWIDGQCVCVTEGKVCHCLSYSKAYRKAMDSGKPLVVHVRRLSKELVDSLPDCVHCYQSEPFENIGTGITVAQRESDYLRILGRFSDTPTLSQVEELTKPQKHPSVVWEPSVLQSNYYDAVPYWRIAPTFGRTNGGIINIGFPPPTQPSWSGGTFRSVGGRGGNC